jgi:hypothetical protein
MPSQYFTDVFRWICAELGLGSMVDGVTDEQLLIQYSNLKAQKEVLRPLLIARNHEKGLAVPEVRPTHGRGATCVTLRPTV